MKWVTREHPKTDRIACPWLIKNFIDPDAEFLFVPTEEVLEVAAARAPTPSTLPGASYTHRDGLCSFEVLRRRVRLDDPALRLLARIVHGADVADDRDVDARVARPARRRRGLPPARSRRPSPARALAAGLRRALRLVQAESQVVEPRTAPRPEPGRTAHRRGPGARALAYGLGSVLIGVTLARRGLSGIAGRRRPRRAPRRDRRSPRCCRRATATASGGAAATGCCFVVDGGRGHGVRADRLAAGAGRSRRSPAPSRPTSSSPGRSPRSSRRCSRTPRATTTRRGSSAPTTRSRRSPARSARCSRSSAPRRAWLLAYPVAAACGARRRPPASRRRSSAATSSTEAAAAARTAPARSCFAARGALRARQLRRRLRPADVHRLPVRPQVRRLAAHARDRLLRDRPAAGALLPGRRPPRRADRAAADDGLHAPAFERAAAAIAFAPEPADRDRAAARAASRSRRWTSRRGRPTSSPSSTRASAPRPPPTRTPPAT